MASFDQENLRFAIAKSIEVNLRRANAGLVESIDYWGVFHELYPDISDSRQILDDSLRAAWNYADSYFDALRHEFVDLDGTAWPAAHAALRMLLEDF